MSQSTYPLFVGMTLLNGTRIMYGTAVPAAASDGTFQAGDVVNNMSVTAAGVASPRGWVCVTGGSPGTWAAWGAASLGVQLISASTGAISPSNQATYVITYNGGAGAYTLAAPTAANNGLIIEITSATAQTHAITATGLLKTGAAAVNVATCANADAGCSLRLMAYNLLWQVLSANQITFS